jgi:hypothetical protein
MEKVSEVETAKSLMTEAMTWSVMKWLREKKRVRKTADLANAALDKLDKTVKTSWAENIKAAYQALPSKANGGATARIGHKTATQAIAPEATLIAKKLKEADDEAYRVRMDAEDTFDEAERQMSTSLAREGCRRAIQCWDLKEKAIRKSQAVARLE